MSLRKLSDGRYEMRYYQDGTKQSTYLRENLGKVSHQDATKIYRQRLAMAAARKGQPGRRLTFSELADEYMRLHGPEMAENSRQRAEDVLRLYLRPIFGHVLVENIKAAHVKRYQQERRGKGAKPATVNREWTILKAILNWGEAQEIIDRNPIRRKSVQLLPAANLKPFYFEPDEWRRFITAFDDAETWKAHVSKVRRLGPVKIGAGSDEARRYGAGRKPESLASEDYRSRLLQTVPVLRTLLYTGSRLGEVLALNAEDVDMKRGLITIYQQKTERMKVLPITAKLKEILSAQPERIGKAPLLARIDGARFTVREIQRAFAVAAIVAGVQPELSPHAIRHTVASWLTIEGYAERHVAEMLGHAGQSVTRRYAHLAPSHMREVVDAIPRIEREGFRDGTKQLLRQAESRVSE